MDCADFGRHVESSWLFYLTGVATIAFVSLKIAYNLYTHFIIYFTSAAVDYRRYGRWALVTGATDGIGKGLARELARMGISIVLVSRNPEKLRRVAREIESEFHVEAQCVPIDFTRADDISTEDLASSVYDVIKEAIRDLEIGILINNVGMNQPKPNPFHRAFGAANDQKIQFEGISNIINCNCLSQVKVTELVLPEMEKRGKGLIINISSASAQVAFPFAALYAATKRFNDHFSRALSHEYEEEGIVVQSIQPGFVHTNLATASVKFNPNILAPEVKTFSPHALKSVGKARMTNGYWLHAAQLWVWTSIPERVYVTCFRLFGNFIKFRKRRSHKVQDQEKKYE